MADINEKNPKNVDGKYYVDTECTNCEDCRELAPDFFAEDEDEGLTYVSKQPSTEEEIELVEEALEGCPVESIGNDG